MIIHRESFSPAYHLTLEMGAVEIIIQANHVECDKLELFCQLYGAINKFFTRKNKNSNFFSDYYFSILSHEVISNLILFYNPFRNIVNWQFWRCNLIWAKAMNNKKQLASCKRRDLLQVFWLSKNLQRDSIENGNRCDLFIVFLWINRLMFFFCIFI